MKQTPVLIIGASVSGLACAASLRTRSIEYTIIEKSGQAATPWRNHYKRLHLHTNKALSNLPYRKFGGSIPRYPSRQQVVDHLDDYQKHFSIQPVLNTEAFSVKRKGGYWITETSGDTYQSEYIIIATGPYGQPKAVHFKGMETFTGSILHSSKYKTGSDHNGQKVLVVGFGNSACEIAIDLYEQGALPVMSVRSPVNVVPRDVFGIPILQLSLYLSHLPAKWSDAINAPLLRFLIGDITKLGLKKMPYGPLQQIEKDGRPPVLDIGTIDHIRQGHIKVYGGIDHLQGRSVYFTDGKKEDFDAIIAATGYRPNYSEIIDCDKSRFEDLKLRADKQKYFGKDGLYFCGFWISPTGQFHEIAKDAKKIAGDIAGKG